MRHFLPHKRALAFQFDCGYSIPFSIGALDSGDHESGVAQRERLNLGSLNPICERELTKLGVYEEGRWKGANDGARRKGCRHMHHLDQCTLPEIHLE